MCVLACRSLFFDAFSTKREKELTKVNALFLHGNELGKKEKKEKTTTTTTTNCSNYNFNSQRILLQLASSFYCLLLWLLLEYNNNNNNLTRLAPMPTPKNTHTTRELTWMSCQNSNKQRTTTSSENEKKKKKKRSGETKTTNLFETHTELTIITLRL